MSNEKQSDLYHEVADRLWVITAMIDNHILQHTMTGGDKEIRVKIEEALEILSEAYQIAASKM